MTTNLWGSYVYTQRERLKSARNRLSKAKCAMLWAGDEELAKELEAIQRKFRERYPCNRPRKETAE